MKSTYLVLCLLMLPIIVPAQEIGKDAVVASTKMNVLYRGLANPIEIAVPGITSDKVTATTTNGTIKRINNGWEVLPGAQSESVITVLVNNRKVSEKIFRIKNVPNPVAVFTGKSNGSTSKDIASKTEVLEAELKDFDWDLNFKIESFKLLSKKDNIDMVLSSKGNKLTDSMRLIIADLKRGQYITIKDIKAIGPDGKSRDLLPIILKID